ncbi:MAG: hypothetical protein CMJ32_03980 [Phycisphaerae bacterium]|nr:hypothetical protein [Phycisphaerae bacterium]
MELMQQKPNTQACHAILATTDSSCDEAGPGVSREVLVERFRHQVQRAIDLGQLAHGQRVLESIPGALRDDPVLRDLAEILPERPKIDPCELQIEVRAVPSRLEPVSA